MESINYVSYQDRKETLSLFYTLSLKLKSRHFSTSATSPSPYLSAQPVPRKRQLIHTSPPDKSPDKPSQTHNSPSTTHPPPTAHSHTSDTHDHPTSPNPSSLPSQRYTVSHHPHPSAQKHKILPANSGQWANKAHDAVAHTARCCSEGRVPNLGRGGDLRLRCGRR